jgi:uncharacterized protein
MRATAFAATSVRGVIPPQETDRIHDLDALRGLALCGIMVVNTWQRSNAELGDRVQVPVDQLIDNLLQGRFYPIFSFLFGVSLVLFLRSAAARTPYPRVTLATRLTVLGLVGAAHSVVNPGEVLLPYALFGIAVLLPASFLPRSLVLLAGVGATAWAVSRGGGVILVPGLFLLGMAAIEYRPSPRLLLPTFVVAVPVAIALTALWPYMWHHPEILVIGVYPAAGLAAATAYATGLLLLLRTRLRPALLGTLAPLGRMALTNYLTATPIILLALPLLTADPTRLSVFGVALLTLAGQIAFARWWLARYRYGPLEWAWRCLTWWRMIPNRIAAPESPRRPRTLGA